MVKITETKLWIYYFDNKESSKNVLFLRACTSVFTV